MLLFLRTRKHIIDCQDLTLQLARIASVQYTMVSENSKEILDPYGHIINTIVEKIHEYLEENYGTIGKEFLRSLVEEPSVEAYGDLSLPLFRLARPLKVNPVKLAEEIANSIDGIPYVKDIKNVSGYVNFFLDYPSLTKLTLDSVRSLGEKYGYLPVDKPLRIVVEHTSANPIHPLHIGHARNAVLGDTLYRLLSRRGHIVQRRFYVNDLGRQVAIMLYGYLNLPETMRSTDVKPDHWIGILYAITHTLIEIYELKKKISEAINKGDNELYRELVRELDSLVASANDLREKNRELFDYLANKLKEKDNEKEIQSLMKKMEAGDQEVKEKLREVVEICLQGFKETLRELDIDFDKWDYESHIVWSSLVKKILEEARKSPYFTIHKGAPALDLPRLASKELYRRLGITLSLEIPPLILQRSDGTTLYTTKDLAYTLYKFRDFQADKVINVIGAEQKLPQAQLKLALYALGYKREAENLIHYSYEMVNIPGMKMSGRLGKYITLDEIIEEAKLRAEKEVLKRTTLETEEEKKQVIEAVAVGAIRYTLVSTAANKPITFNWEQALSFETNAAPYIQYTHARASSILRKHEEKYGPIQWDNIDYNAILENKKRAKLIKLIAKYPSTQAKAADDLKPEILVDYINKLADTFNSWYQEDPVIHEPNPGKRNLKTTITYAVKIVLANTLETLGIKAPPRM